MPERSERRLGQACGGLALALAVAASPAAAAPDEIGYGVRRGYQTGTPLSMFEQDHLVGAFSNMETLFPTRTVPAGISPRPLPPQTGNASLPFLQAYLDTQPLTGLIVLQDGQIVVERYQYAREATHRFTSFSMAKTVVGLAFGIAVEEGLIASLDDPVDRYVPALAETAWAQVPLRHVLTMSSGVRFEEIYTKPGNDIDRMARAWYQQRGSSRAELLGHTTREARPGTLFHYSSADTQVLALVLAAATGQPLARYVGDRLWAPMGAETDAAWILEGDGEEAAYCCLSARLRDWARLGQLMLERGSHDGRQIVPAAWIDAATGIDPQAKHLHPRSATSYFGYGYQTWIFPDDLGFALMGVGGQAIFVNAKLKLVMVQTAVWPEHFDPLLAYDRDVFWRNLNSALAVR